MTRSLTIATRGSPLALAQTHQVRDRLAASHPDLAVPGAIEIRIIKTTGDTVQDRPLAEIGGKGLFTKEIEEALLAGEADLAVHSMKDVATWLPDGLEIACLLPREDPRDAWFAGDGAGPDTLPSGAVVGTASLRRQAQILARRPDLKVVTLRGNVATRLRKLEEGQVHATLLAVAGLRRLGRGADIRRVLDPEEMLPAVAQGAVGVEVRAEDTVVRDLLAPLHCPATALRVAAERGLLEMLDGSCRTPIAALAEPASDGALHLEALAALPDGSELHRISRHEPAATSEAAAALGADAGAELKGRLGSGFFTRLEQWAAG